MQPYELPGKKPRRERNASVLEAFAAAIDLFEGDEDAARRWFEKPCPMLSGRVPRDVALTPSGADEVRRAISAMGEAKEK